MPGRKSSTRVIRTPIGISQRRQPGGGGGAGAAGRSLGGPERALVVIGVLGSAAHQGSGSYGVPWSCRAALLDRLSVGEAPGGPGRPATPRTASWYVGRPGRGEDRA